MLYLFSIEEVGGIEKLFLYNILATKDMARPQQNLMKWYP